MNIERFIVHKLVVSDEGKLDSRPRSQCLPIGVEIEQLGSELHRVFADKPGKGLGYFLPSPTDDSDSFIQQLQQYLAQPDDEAFVRFSQHAVRRLVTSLLNVALVETGFVTMNHYHHLATEYLFIALLNTRDHVEVTPHLELSMREHLDLSKMQLAVMIDLTQFRVQPDLHRYLSFIKGRMGRKVSDFFMAFLGCEEKLDTRQQAKQWVGAVEEYLTTTALDPHEQKEHRQAVSEYVKDKIKTQTSIQLHEVAEIMPAPESKMPDFVSMAKERVTDIGDEIAADRAMLKQLNKFSGQGKGMTISFDRTLFGDRVHYDVNSDTLSLQGIPPNLRDQLMRWLNRE